MSQYVRFPLDRFIQGRIRLQNPDKLDFDYRACKIAGPWVPLVEECGFGIREIYKFLEGDLYWEHETLSIVEADNKPSIVDSIPRGLYCSGQI